MNAEQEKALREYLQEAIVPLIEQVLIKKLGQAMSFAAEQLIQPKREWQGLTDEQITDVIRTSSLYMKPSPHTPQSVWLALLMGYARAIEAKLKEKNKW